MADEALCRSKASKARTVRRHQQRASAGPGVTLLEEDAPDPAAESENGQLASAADAEAAVRVSLLVVAHSLSA
jgi:hypothetical protein